MRRTFISNIQSYSTALKYYGSSSSAIWSLECCRGPVQHNAQSQKKKRRNILLSGRNTDYVVPVWCNFLFYGGKITFLTINSDFINIILCERRILAEIATSNQCQFITSSVFIVWDKIYQNVYIFDYGDRCCDLFDISSGHECGSKWRVQIDWNLTWCDSWKIGDHTVQAAQVFFVPRHPICSATGGSSSLQGIMRVTNIVPESR